MARGPKGKLSHQWRLTARALNAARRRLGLRERRLRRTRSFNQLFRIISTLLKPIRGVGELYYYDTSLRIGMRLGLMPTEVYLHAGPREGAKALKLNYWQPFLPVNAFKPPFAQLQPHEIENLLCIYRSVLGRMI